MATEKLRPLKAETTGATGALVDDVPNCPKSDGYKTGSDPLHPIPYELPLCAQGYSGVSQRASRADHVHPLAVNPTQKPKPIGSLPHMDSNAQNLREEGNAGGVFGRFGNPTRQTPDFANSYSLSNHCHAYGFLTAWYKGGSLTQTSASAMIAVGENGLNELYSGNSLNLRFANADGTKTFHQYAQSSAGDSLCELQTSVDFSVEPSAEEKTRLEVCGWCGGSPLPARSDHSHPLNVVRLGTSVGTDGCNATGSTGDWVKKVGGGNGNTTGDLGTARFYARVDHVHPFDTGTGADRYLSYQRDSKADAALEANATNKTNRWVRFSATYNGQTGTTSNGIGGVVEQVLTRVAQVGVNIRFFFRTNTYDSNGLLKEVSAEYYADVEAYKIN